MSQHLADEDTVIAATYANRQDAEIAKTRLAEHDIEALIVADDTHPSFQFTEGVKLHVLESKIARASRILKTANVSVGEAQADDEDGISSHGAWVQATAWTYVATFVVMVALVLTGLFVGL